jgi:hypothetical protein
MEGDNKERNNEREKEKTKNMIENEEGTKETEREEKRQNDSRTMDFFCSLFDDTVNKSGYIAWNDWMIVNNELERM